MRAYGKKKTRGTVAGHQNCTVCHAEQKNMKARARRLRGIAREWEESADQLEETNDHDEARMLRMCAGDVLSELARRSTKRKAP